MAELTDLEKEFYADIINSTTEKEEEKIVDEEKIIEQEEENIVEEQKEIVSEEKKLDDTPAPYKSKKFIEVEDEAALYDKLGQKVPSYKNVK